MIKTVLVRLDGSAGDEFRMAATESLCRLFDAHVVGVFFNVLPDPGYAMDPASPEIWASLNKRVRQNGDEMAARLGKRLEGLGRSAELRRFDVYATERPGIIARECRTADVFVGLRLSDADREIELHELVERALFESGRHLFLAADQKTFDAGFDHALIAWNRSREAARAVAEALPYLGKARRVTVVTIERDAAIDELVRPDRAMPAFLDHHGIPATMRRIEPRERDTSKTLIAEISEQGADLLVMGGYGHSRLREWVLGGVTYNLLRKSPVAMVVAH
jgi:nucleotide-binding universal stress UspA family protein